MNHRFALPFLFVVLGLTSCSDLGEPFVEPRILPGISIDGVKLGDPLAVVEQMLGSIHRGEADGDPYSWQYAQYMEGPHAGLNVCYPYVLTADRHSYLPLIVDWVLADSLYAGTTARGSGIGSTQESFRMEFGTPCRSTYDPSRGTQSDSYCFGDVEFRIRYRDGKAISLYMGDHYHLLYNRACQ